MRTLIVLGALLVLGGVNYSIHARSRSAPRRSDVLDLAPVDPRSLMQGDGYMALRFAVAGEICSPATRRNTVLLQLDFARVARMPEAGSAGFLRVRYRMRNGQPGSAPTRISSKKAFAARFTPARLRQVSRRLRRAARRCWSRFCDAQLEEL